MCDWKIFWSEDNDIINNNVEVFSGDYTGLIFLW